MNGILVIDKPAGLSSHDVVNRVRRILDQRSVGHLGTLDPLATGILPLVVGNLTRLAQFYTGSEKSYEGSIRFGFSTDTYDADGDPTSAPQAIALSLDQITRIAAQFQGSIAQIPPPFSAKKIKGVPAYKLARKNQDVPLAPVQVEVKEFQILACDGDRATFRARVSSGTYIRSIAHEIGRILGCGAHLAALRRTMVAEFALADAHTLASLESARREDRIPEGGPADDRLEELFIHPRKLLPHFPSVAVNEEQAARIRTGQTVNLPEFSNARFVKAFQGQRDLIAIATRVAGTLFHPGIVFAHQSVATPFTQK
jgi:tRNA pseudouridine55 synthase